MKLIEALKELKYLPLKAQDLRNKIKAHSAMLSFETPIYPEQKKQIDSWLQAHKDILARIEDLTAAVAKTNHTTDVTIKLGDKSITKPLASWIIRRRKLAAIEREAWVGLTDKNLKDGTARNSAGESVDIRVVRFYEPAMRDSMIENLTQEPSLIDASLEIVNATTDVIGM